MTETIDSSTAPDAAASAPKKRGGGLNSLLLADLKSMAGGMGISGAKTMKKAQLVDAIKAAQSGGQSGGQSAPVKVEKSADKAAETPADKAAETPAETPGASAPVVTRTERTRRTRDRQQDREEPTQRDGDREAQAQRDREAQPNRDREAQANRDREAQANRDREAQANRDRDRDRQQDRNPQDRTPQDRGQQDRGQQDAQGEEGGGRNRRRRGRDRNNRQAGPVGAGRNEPDTTVLEDDVLVPAAGILDVLDNYAFVRTSGYLPGTEDVYVSLSMVRKYGLRRGDAILGQVRQPREGEGKAKFNPMVHIESVNGADPETAKNRVEFQKLTPLYASERLRLETEPGNLIGRVIDIAAPIGKGQRGLIVSPSKAGKTMIMQSIANSITTNNPECHLMVVLVDERPEEVTDFERSVKGEVISSTFDRPASDHTMVAELAIERAKRLVELGHDVVVLLDGITRLGRAYNLAAPASGRILSGGVDSAALYPPKKFFGAARNIENGGSLTILATALIESGSKMDEVIFEEFKGTGNMEIRLRRDFADKRIFPAIDAVQSGTRREELLMSKEELAIIWKLRRVLSGLDSQQALELLLERLKKSQNNMEFLLQVQKTTPTAGGSDD
ncbi:transcription termination factor Rho [Nocardioides psychrotolerans]|uniref:transcription termination factor Rho n=1 Tax=Nocardioides psychrotolerans TaxID=1005945 RepID=UPI00313807BD